MTRENKFILFVLLILVAVFSFVVFRNFQKKGGKEELAKTGSESDNAKAKDSETGNANTESNGKPTDDKSVTTDSTAKSEKRKKSEDSTPAADENEPPQLATDMFEEEAEKPVKITAHRNGKHRGTAQTPPEEPASNDELVNTETAETATRSRTRQPAEFDAATNQAATAEEEIALTPATRPRNTQARSRRQEAVDDLIEGTAESTETPMESEPAEMPSRAADDFANSATFDPSVEQTAATEDKSAKHRAARKNPAHTTETDELAQAGAPMVPDEMTTGATPHRAPSHRTGTGNRASGVPAAPPQQSMDLPPANQANEDKFGGMQPHDVTRRPAGPRGTSDTQIDPLVANTGEYVIRPNDNYWRISRKVYGTPRYFEALRKHNELTTPDTKSMKVGTRIATPSIELLERQYQDLIPAMAAPKPPGAVFDSPTAPKTPGYFMEPGNQPAYRVGPMDTLSGISQKTLGRSTRWDEIYELNRDRIPNHDRLTLGTILRLPPDASQPRVVGSPATNY